MGLSGHIGRPLTPCQSQWDFLVLVNQIMPLLSSQASDGFYHCQNKPQSPHPGPVCASVLLECSPDAGVLYNLMSFMLPLKHHLPHVFTLYKIHPTLLSFSALFFIILMPHTLYIHLSILHYNICLWRQDFVLFTTV